VYDVGRYGLDDYFFAGNGKELFVAQPLTLRENKVAGNRLPADKTDQLIHFVLEQEITVFPSGLFKEHPYAFEIDVDTHSLFCSPFLMIFLLHDGPLDFVDIHDLNIADYI
jgi:hypothetical protein